MAKTYPVWIRVVAGVRLEIEAASPEEAAKKATEVDFGEFMNRDIRLEDGGDVAKHMQYDDGTEHQGVMVTDGDEEVAWGPGHDFEEEKKSWEPCSPGCKGWVHMSSPYEIEACDACGRFDGIPERDEAARAAHQEECKGCLWPEFDYQDAAMAWVNDIIHYDQHDPDGKPSPLHDLIMELHGYCEERGAEFVESVPHAIQVCVKAIDLTPEGSPVRNRFGSLLKLLKIVREKLEKEELKLKDFGEPPEPKFASIKKEMSLEEMIEAAHHRYTDPSILDDYVHEAKGEEASSINNSGVEAQVRFLYEQWGPDGAQAVLFDDFQCTDPECPDAKETPYHDHPKED